MTFNNLKKIFQNELTDIYPNREIDSFFYLLTEAFMDLKRADIALDPKYEIDKINEEKFISALAKLKNETPIQYIIGETEFYGLTLIVNKNVLIPRPETEELVSWVLNEVKTIKDKVERKNQRKSSLKILDIGTGSGCIAIALAKELPESDIWALDISDNALKIAKENAILNNVNIQFLNKDILKTKELPLKFDIIVSNPPYVKQHEISKMRNNILLNEPHLALFVEDHKPFIFYDKIANLALNNLHKNGLLFFEINQAFGKEMIQLLKIKGYKNIELRKDIFGNDRMVKADLN